MKALNADIQAVANRTGEVLFGRVRSTATVPAGEGDLWLLDTPNTARRLSPAKWEAKDAPFPGYSPVNFVFDINGFWLSARDDLLDRTFYVLNVVNNLGRLYRVTRQTVDDCGPAGWHDPHGTNNLGMFFDVNGFWVSME